MSRFNHHPSRKYRDLVRRLGEYDGEETIIRPVAEALEDKLRERFKKKYGLDEKSSGSACAARLIAGWSGCQHNLPRKGDDSEAPPHHPPHADHVDLWLRDGEPEALSMHLYDLRGDELRDIVSFADHWGLDVEIEPASWYFSNRTVCVVFTPPRSAE